MSVSLVGTFNEDFLSFRIAIVDNHADRIKAYHLLNGFGKCLSIDSGSNSEILQLVVDEHDSIVGLLLGELVKSIGDRHIIIIIRDTFLSLRADSQQ